MTCACAQVEVEVLHKGRRITRVVQLGERVWGQVE